MSKVKIKGLCHSHIIFMLLILLYACVSEKPSIPELWSEEEVSGDLGSGLNMLGSGLICAFSGGAGGGTDDSMLF